MLDRNKHINNEPQLSKEAQEIIARGEIQWKKSKEEIWMEMEDKLESPAVKFVRLRMLMAKYSQYAAVAAFVLLIGFGATAAIYTKTIETGLAQETEFVLPDDSRVSLHENSNISYKPLLWFFKRSTQLSGEAYFEVEKGKKFEVVSEKAKTVVLGTKFTVYARDNDYRVECTSGKVKVIEPTHQHEAIITAGEKAMLQANNQFKVSAQIKKPAEAVEQEVSPTPIPKPLPKIETEPSVSNEAKEAVREQNRETHKTMNAEKAQIKHEENMVEQAKSILEEKANATEPTAKQEKAQTQNKAEKEPAKAENKNEEAAKKRFRNSLSKKQVEILENESMNKEERRKAFMKSLSEEQINMLREQNKGAVKGNNEFENGKNRAGQEMQEVQKNQQRQQMKNTTPNESEIKGKNGGIEKNFKQNGNGNKKN